MHNNTPVDSLIPNELHEIISSSIKCAEQDSSFEPTRKAIELFKEFIKSILDECNKIRNTLNSQDVYTRVNNGTFITDLSLGQRFNFTPGRLTSLDLTKRFTAELYRTENIKYLENLGISKSEIEIILIYNEIIGIALDKLDRIKHY